MGKYIVLFLSIVLYGHSVSAGVVTAVVMGTTCGNTCAVANEA